MQKIKLNAINFLPANSRFRKMLENAFQYLQTCFQSINKWWELKVILGLKLFMGMLTIIILAFWQTL